MINPSGQSRLVSNQAMPPNSEDMVGGDPGMQDIPLLVDESATLNHQPQSIPEKSFDDGVDPPSHDPVPSSDPVRKGDTGTSQQHQSFRWWWKPSEQGNISSEKSWWDMRGKQGLSDRNFGLNVSWFPASHSIHSDSRERSSTAVHGPLDPLHWWGKDTATAAEVVGWLETECFHGRNDAQTQMARYVVLFDLKYSLHHVTNKSSTQR